MLNNRCKTQQAKQSYQLANFITLMHQNESIIYTHILMTEITWRDSLRISGFPESSLVTQVIQRACYLCKYIHRCPHFCCCFFHMQMQSFAVVDQVQSGHLKVFLPSNHNFIDKIIPPGTSSYRLPHLAFHVGLKLDTGTITDLLNYSLSPVHVGRSSIMK